MIKSLRWPFPMVATASTRPTWPQSSMSSGALEHGNVPWAAGSGLDALGKPPRGGEVVVLDSYELDAAQVRRWAGEAALVAFWDQGKPPPADLVVSLALEVPGGLSGPRY